MLAPGFGAGPAGLARGMSHDVFISYVPRDKTAANAVRAVLESQGLTCWIASRDLVAGVNAQDATIDAIISAKAFVLLFSANTNATEDQVVREVGLAFDRQLPVIGFRTANIAPSDTLRHFLKMHWIDAFVPPLDTHMRELSDLLLGILGRRGGIVPTLKAFVPAGAPALKSAAALAKNLPVKIPNLPTKLPNLPVKIELKGLPTLTAIDHEAFVRKVRKPLLIAAAVIALGAVGAGAWISLRPHATPQDDQAWQTAAQTDSVPG